MEHKNEDPEAQMTADEEPVNYRNPTLELTTTRSNIASPEDNPPDGGYGWVCAISLLFINAHTWGVNSV